ncbi:MAG: tetratricopeptide repeat protein [Chitinophagales bacterium]
MKKFLEENPDDAFVNYALAIEHVNVGDDETALHYFKSLLEKNPDYTGAYYHLGKLYLRRNENQLAEHTFKEGMKRTFGKEPHAYTELLQAMHELFSDEE